MAMIDEKKLIDKLEDKMRYMIVSPNGKHLVSVEAVIEFVEAFPKEKDWIPCSEGLPEEDMSVIICTNDGMVCEGQYTERYGYAMRRGFFAECGFIISERVIAWQPLPEPYRGE